MLKSPLSQHRSSTAPSPTVHYAHLSPRLSICPTCASQNSKIAKPSPRATQYVGVDASTQWSPMSPKMNVDGSKQDALELETDDSKPQPAAAASSYTTIEAEGEKAPPPSKPASIAESPTMKRRQSQAVDTGGTQTEDKTQTLPPKRVRSARTQVKVLPLRYELCDVEDMVILIANMISELIQTNDELPLRTGVLTRFHSRTPPGISVMDYLHRLAKHATLTPPLLLSMVYYIDRLCALYPAFTITTLTVHRFLITAATVAAKGLSDSFWNNATYARVGGVKVAELGLLELDFLYRVDWRIVPNPEVLVDYYRGLVERSEGEEDEDEEEDEEEDGEGREEGDKRRVATVAIGSSSPPTRLADITYDSSTLQADLISFEAPELASGSKLARIGIYDLAKSTWISSTSLTSMESFTKGHAITFFLSIDNNGSIVGVSCKGSKIDAGQTRDFGPKVKLSKSEKAKRPELNKPVILSPEGKLPEDIPEKTLLQKYAVLILNATRKVDATNINGPQNREISTT
ncbi:hypothetical protein B7463_g10213, partial [Scytalidium lignicola]